MPAKRPPQRPPPPKRPAKRPPKSHHKAANAADYSSIAHMLYRIGEKSRAYNSADHRDQEYKNLEKLKLVLNGADH